MTAVVTEPIASNTSAAAVSDLRTTSWAPSIYRFASTPISITAYREVRPSDSSPV
jgi:hypothetical protein